MRDTIEDFVASCFGAVVWAAFVALLVAFVAARGAP